MKFLPKSFLFLILSVAFNSYAQTPTPFTICPGVLAIARPGTNTYNSEAVSIYIVDPVTGSASLIPGGPLKNPAAPANNMDLNGAGINVTDGLLYGMGANSTTSQKFYRIGSNYAANQVGVITPPPVSGLFEVGIVNPAAGEFDASGNYFFTAVTGTGFPIPTPTFFPSAFYLGKISNVSSLPVGTANITPAYTALDFSSAVCSPYYLTLISAISQSTAQNTGLRDLVFSPRDGNLYTFVSYELPSGSGTFFGQLLSVNPSTGIVTCYAPAPLSFASASNEVAGTAMTPSGAIDILFTGGDVYKTVFTAPNTYTGAISFAGNSGIPATLRGDLAACVTGAVLAVNFEDVSAFVTPGCSVQVNWKTAQEQNVNHYEIQSAAPGGTFTTLDHSDSLNTATEHSYVKNITVTGKAMLIRIKTINNDGSISYSKIISIATHCDKAAGITVLNNAAVSDQVQVLFENISATGNYTLSIYNNYGALVSVKNISLQDFGSVYSMDAGIIAPGSYFITAQSAGGERLSARFIKK